MVKDILVLVPAHTRLRPALHMQSSPLEAGGPVLLDVRLVLHHLLDTLHLAALQGQASEVLHNSMVASEMPQNCIQRLSHLKDQASHEGVGRAPHSHVLGEGGGRGGASWREGVN